MRLLRLLSDEFTREVRLEIVTRLELGVESIKDEGYIPLRGATEDLVVAALAPRVQDETGEIQGRTLFISLTGNRFCMFANKLPGAICIADSTEVYADARRFGANMIEVSATRHPDEILEIAMRFAQV